MDLAENDTPCLFRRRIGYGNAARNNSSILNDVIDFADNRTSIGNRFLADPDDVLLEERGSREVAETVGVLKDFGVDQAGRNPIRWMKSICQLGGAFTMSTTINIMLTFRRSFTECQMASGETDGSAEFSSHASVSRLAR